MSLIELHDLSKTYIVGENKVPALREVNLRIEEGDFVAIIGPSGSGKSTLMHLLGFLDTPTSGELFFDSRALSRLNSNERATIRAEKIGFVFQSFNLLPRLNVLKNTLLPISYSRHRMEGMHAKVRGVLERVGMEDRMHHRPNQLSGGQRQRVAIARALINEPRLILADEPTGNLDSVTAKSILELFSLLNRQGCTVVMVTHDPTVASYARRHVRVLDGRVLEEQVVR